MPKLFLSLFFFISFNCVATLPINCTNIANNTPKTIANILNYLCYYNDLNKINCITKNTSILNDWIAKGYFVIVDQANNIVLLPYEILKKLLLSSYFGYTTLDLIEDSNVISVKDSSTIPKIINTSSIVKLPVNSINKFIAYNEYDRYYGKFSVKHFVTALIIIGSAILVIIITCVCVSKFKSKKKNRLIPRRNIDIEKESMQMQEGYSTMP